MFNAMEHGTISGMYTLIIILCVVKLISSVFLYKCDVVIIMLYIIFFYCTQASMACVLHCVWYKLV